VSTVTATRELYHQPAHEHLRGRIEQVGFFLADFDAARRAFALREWRPMPPEAFEFQSAYHVTLRDEVRPEVIKWAWDRHACLLEVHSHADQGPAGFSPSDMWGFDEWVPHVRWRLRGRPYAAIVTAGDTFDALAWLDGTGEPSQVEQLEVDGAICTATARTLLRLAELRKYGDGD
jgi:hypothetical protein